MQQNVLRKNLLNKNQFNLSFWQEIWTDYQYKWKIFRLKHNFTDYLDSCYSHSTLFLHMKIVSKIISTPLLANENHE
jgi:hypothetical protein